MRKKESVRERESARKKETKKERKKESYKYFLKLLSQQTQKMVWYKKG